LKQLAKDARIALETNNLQSLANIIDTGRRAGNLIFSTNQSPLLDDLLRKALNFKSAVKFTGAGGGGYALFLSPDLQKADALKEYLSKQKENKASVVPFSINERGLEITIM
jgi:galactokinase/mevalonate kinase-like predicted kinase